MLYGRDSERAVVDALLADARAGRSGVLVIRGEAGIGKTALLEHAAESGSDMPVLHGVGIESEAELAFAGLHLLLKRDLDRLNSLPRSQADALKGALGLGAASGGDRFLVGLAVLSLLTELAGDGPLLCLIDDAQWIDRASADALLFAARRLESEGVALIFAAREEGHAFEAPGLPELELTRLDSAAAGRLLTEHGGTLAALLRDRILTEAAGNPLALIELPGLLAQTAELTADVADLSVPRRIEELYRTVVGALPQRARDLLLIAATDDTGELGLVLRAAQALGASADDLTVTEQAQLIQLTPTRIAFRHPLIRAATYHGAPVTKRWAAHRALADALTSDADAERRAHHLAALATGPDETIAAELTHSAKRSRSRGALAAAVTAYERAAQLSVEPTAQAERFTLAAEAAAELAEHSRATALVAQAEPLTDDQLLRARLAMVRGHASYALGQLAAAYRHLHDAVRVLQATEPQRALWLLMEMVDVTYGTGDRDAAAECAEALDTLQLPPDDPLKPIRQLMRWTAYRVVGADTSRLPPLPDTILAALQVEAGGLRGQLFTADQCLFAGHNGYTYRAVDTLVSTIRTRGIIGLLPQALSHLAHVQLFSGRHREARATAFEAIRIAEVTEQQEWVRRASSVLALLAAYEGDEEACQRYTQVPVDSGDDATVPSGQWALSLLDLGLGRVAIALERFEALAQGPTRFQLRVLRTTPDLVEAAVRSGQPARAADALARLRQWAAQAQQPWVDALVLRCDAMLASDDEAERLYLDALEAHEPGLPLEPARTALLYGEWLRRNRRRNDARPHLRAALDTFERLGADPWAERARTELRAAGESIAATERVPDLLDQLTPQELQIVRLAAAGHSNRAIGAQLFLSPRTVGYHLYKAYPKLGVASRGELARLHLDTAPVA